MSTRRARELWRHKQTGERYLVEVEDGRVLSSHGPLGEDEVSEEGVEIRTAAHGRSPAFTAEAADMQRRKDEFERKALEGTR